MRRKDREMSETFAWEVAKQCEWATLGLIDPSGEPYVVPVSIASEDRHIYFHSAQSGFKIECLRKYNQVCVSCVGDTRRLTNAFTTAFSSATLRGSAVEIMDEQEKIHALRLLCQRHVPANMNHFSEEIAKYLSKTAVWRIDVTEITGKQNKAPESET